MQDGSVKIEGWILRPPCLEHFSRTEKLEHKMIEISQQVGVVEEIGHAVKEIQLYIAKQNGTLPRLEQTLSEALRRLSNEEMMNQKSNVSSKYIWAIAACIGTALVSGGTAAMIKLLGG